MPGIKTIRRQEPFSRPASVFKEPLRTLLMGHYKARSGGCHGVFTPLRKAWRREGEERRTQKILLKRPKLQGLQYDSIEFGLGVAAAEGGGCGQMLPVVP
jgi:hypothetical protein